MVLVVLDASRGQSFGLESAEHFLASMFSADTPQISNFSKLAVCATLGPPKKTLPLCYLHDWNLIILYCFRRVTWSFKKFSDSQKIPRKSSFIVRKSFFCLPTPLSSIDWAFWPVHSTHFHFSVVGTYVHSFWIIEFLRQTLICAEIRWKFNLFSQMHVLPLLLACTTIESQEASGGLLVRAALFGTASLRAKNDSIAETFVKNRFLPPCIDITWRWCVSCIISSLHKTSCLFW